MAICASPVLGNQNLRIAIIPWGLDKQFGHEFLTGVERAESHLRDQGLSVLELVKDPRENPRLQQRMVREAIAAKVNGIVLAPLDRQILAPEVKLASRHRIPVVTAFSGVDSTAPVSWVGPDDYEAGCAAARLLASALHGHGNVILLRHHINCESTEELEEGFLGELHLAWPGVHLLVTDFHAGPSPGTARRVCSLLLTRFRSSVNGIFASSQVAGSAALTELRELDLAGHVKLVTVEDQGGDQTALRSGDLLGVINLNPGRVGYYSLIAIVNAVRERLVFPIEDTGFTLDTRGTLNAPEPHRLPANTEPISGSTFPVPSSYTPSAVVAKGHGTFVVSDLGLVMVGIRPGTFTMGVKAGQGGFRDDDNVAFTATISKPYWLGMFEVTQMEWRKIMGGNPSDFIGPLLPVDNVSWNDATAFCRRLDKKERAAGRLPPGYVYTLPTEAQWEYACRAGQPPPTGAEIMDSAWSVANSGSWSHPQGPAGRRAPAQWRLTTHPVGQKMPNAWGLFDMCGNVAEWCRDLYGPYPTTPTTDPTGPSKGRYRVFRGGAWWTDSEVCNPYTRGKAPPARHHSGLGFRLALSPTSS